jgi:arylsulfatase A-like enzyme
MPTARVFCAVVGVLVAAGGCARETPKANQTAFKRADGARPNIVLISIDTLRRDHLGCYGYPRATSPRIDQLAAEGAVFENMISSSSWTLPAHAAMFTGLADSVHGALDITSRLPDDRVTLAERLKKLGYATVGFFSGPPLYPAYGLGQGFDAYVDCTSYPELSAQSAVTGVTRGGPLHQAARKDITGPRVVEKVQAWLSGAAPRPFFMFIHLWDVHPDFIPPPPYDRMFDPDYAGTETGEDFLFSPTVHPAMPKRDLEHIIALYDGEIAWTDAHVGQILDHLDALKLRDSTIVLLLSDHGEEFLEHGSKGHRHTLFDELIRIPLIVRYPGYVPAGRRFAEQARMIDVPSTLLALASAPPPTDVMGQSLAPLFVGGKLAGDTLAISELFSHGQQLRTFRRPERKLIRDEQTGGLGVVELGTDPGEHKPLADTSNPLVRAALRDGELGTKWLNDFKRIVPRTTAAPQLSDDVRRQLESLGYLRGKEE